MVDAEHQGKASPRCCSSTSPRSRAPTASSGSPPRRFRQPGDAARLQPRRLAGPAPLRERPDRGRVPAHRHRARSSTRSSSASSAPTAAPSPACCCPKSIAVIGASDTPGHDRPASSGATRSAASTVRSIPVNPTHDHVGGAAAYAARWPTSPTRSGWQSSPCRPSSSRRRSTQCIAKRVRGAVVITVDRWHRRRHGRAGRACAPQRNAPDRAGQHGRRVAACDRRHARRARAGRARRSGNVAISMQSGTLGASLLQLAAAAVDGHLVVRLARRQVRHLRQRPAPVLGGRREHSCDRDVHRVVRQPTQVRPHRPPRRPHSTDRRRAHGHGRDRQRGVDALYQQAGSDRGADGAGDARHGARARLPTDPGRTQRRDRHQLAQSRRARGGSRHGCGAGRRSTPRWRWTGEPAPTTSPRAIDAAADDESVDAMHGDPRSTAGDVARPDREIDDAALRSTKPVVAIMLGRDDGAVARGIHGARRSRSPNRLPRRSAACTPTAAGCEQRRTHRSPTIDGVDGDSAAGVIAAATTERTAPRSRTTRLRACSAAYGVSSPRGAVSDDAGRRDRGDRRRHRVSPSSSRRSAVVSVARRGAGIALDLADEEAVRDAVDHHP